MAIVPQKMPLSCKSSTVPHISSYFMNWNMLSFAGSFSYLIKINNIIYLFNTFTCF